MAFQRAILPAVLSWADKLVMIGKYWNTYLIACQCYIYYIAYTTEESEKLEVRTLAEKLGGDMEAAIRQLAEDKQENK